MDKYPVRGRFEKFGRAVFISHLDLMRTMQRAIKRSRIPVWYSQGFNPRIYLNFPLALSLGVESSCEFMDFEIVEEVPYDKLLDAINGVLPEGLHFTSMAAPVYKNKEIASAEYELRFYGSDMADKFGGFMAQDNIIVEKHSKSKGTVEMDIKPYITVNSMEDRGEYFFADIILPSGMELNINSNVLTDAFAAYCGNDIEKISAKRTKIVTKDGMEFA